jgi:hypothetical protein
VLVPCTDIPPTVIIELVAQFTAENVPLKIEIVFNTHRVKLSVIVNVPAMVFIPKVLAHTFPALVNVLLPLSSNVYVCVLAVSVVRLVRLIEPNTLQAVEVVQVLLELPVKSTLPIRGISCVIVTVPAVVNVAVSCGSGIE